MRESNQPTCPTFSLSVEAVMATTAWWSEKQGGCTHPCLYCCLAVVVDVVVVETIDRDKNGGRRG
jgi:hypothetical protein